MNEFDLRMSDAEYEGWPVVFFVCKEHKTTFFADYANAIESAEETCILCDPLENDSLGG